MNTSGEVADLMVKESIQITESAMKLAGLGAKNLAAIIIALLKENTKLQGKTTMKQLLKADKPLCILQIKEKDLKTFQSEAKKYGVLFSAVSDKTKKTGLCDIIAKQEDVTKLNHIMEKMKYPVPKFNSLTDANSSEKVDVSKNAQPRAIENLPENESMRRGDMERTGSDTNQKPSVREKVEEYKAEIRQSTMDRTPEQQRTSNLTNTQKKKVQEGKLR